jgi:hypothetical protein
MQILRQDAQMLAQCSINDYSLLVGEVLDDPQQLL